MNYKRERLTKTLAIPSIYIVPDTHEEIDLAKNPTAWVIENKKRPLPASFNKTSRINLDMAADMTTTLQEDEDEDALLLVEEQKTSPVIKKRKIESPASTTVVRILNKTPGSNEIPVRKALNTLPTVKTTSPTTNVVKVSSGSYTIRQVPGPKILKQEILTPRRLLEQKISTPKRVVEQEFIVPFPVTDEPVEAVPVASLSSPAQSTSSLNLEELKPIMRQITEIKQMLNKQQEAPPVPVTVKEESTNISQSQLNKVQLFNGIKRYLSPSMIALLRMELFAAPGREYKTDEKIICQELLTLGEDTYSFLSDEWRLRLPAKTAVQGWIDSKISEEDDDAS